jgi:hypothetical protein
MPRRASTLVTLLGSCMLAQAALGESAPRPDGGDEGADRTLPDQGFEDVGPVEDARVLIDTGASADAEVRTDAVVPLDDAAAQDAGVAPSPDTGIAPLETAPPGGGCAVAAPGGGAWVRRAR